MHIQNLILCVILVVICGQSLNPLLERIEDLQRAFPFHRGLLQARNARPLTEVEKWWALPSSSDSLSRRAPQVFLKRTARETLETYVYQAGELLGKGAFGVVFAVMKNGKKYAAKLPLDSQKTDSILREIDTYHDIGPHDFMLRLRDALEYDVSVGINNTNRRARDHRAIMIFDYHERKDLTSWMKEKNLSTWPTRSLTEMMIGITEGMLHMLAAGYHHMDMKPDNILVQRKGNLVYPLISDLGCVQRSSIGYPFGDRKYMAPEGLLQGHRLQSTEKVDVFALGITFFQILMGKRPFGSDPRSIVEGATKSTWRQMGSSRTAADQWLRLFTKMFDADPRYRATLNEVLAMLKEILKRCIEKEVEGQKPKSKPEPAPKSKSKPKPKQ